MNKVITPPIFNVFQPADILVDNVSALNSSFIFPIIKDTYDADATVVYSANALLGGYIIRDTVESSGPYTDYFDSATNIIQAMTYKLAALTMIQKFVNGTNFKCTFYNRSDASITLASTGTTYVCAGSEGSVVISPGTVVTLQVTVTDQESLGGTDVVYVTVCGGNTKPLPESTTVTCSFIQNSIPALGPYNYYYDITWDAYPNASSYQYNTDCPDDYIIVLRGPLAARLYTSSVSSFNITVIGVNDSGSASATTNVNPCFLAGSLVTLADGTTKAIEDISIGDMVIGAFGEINTVLALHRPVLGKSMMCHINHEHYSTSHHPHVTHQKGFCCPEPENITKAYGQEHQVIVDYEGTKETRFLAGLKLERIQTMTIGTMLKTIEGHREVVSLELLSMPEDTQLYNLVISGSHTYHVDGYAVTGWPNEQDFDYDKWEAK